MNEYYIDENGRKYIYDMTTSNESFIQTHLDLEKLGIKNNKFFMKLYDETLQGVDPYSKELTIEQKTKVMNECSINVWYFLRECVRVKRPDYKYTFDKFTLNRAHLASTWLTLNSIDHYKCIPRQLGNTLSVINLYNWFYLLGTTESNFEYINYDLLASNNIDTAEYQVSILPEYINKRYASDTVRTRKSIEDILYNKITLNQFHAHYGIYSKLQAKNLGHSLNQNFHHFDNFEFIKYNDVMIENSRLPYKKTKDNCIKQNKPCCAIYTSVAGDLDTKEGSYALDFVRNMCLFMEVFYDIPINEVKEYIKQNSSNNIVYIEYQYNELHKDNEWFKHMAKMLNNNPALIGRELLLKRFHSSNIPQEIHDQINTIINS